MNEIIIGDTPAQLGQIATADAMMIDGQIVTKADYLALAAQVEVLREAYKELSGAINDLGDCESETEEFEQASANVFAVMQHGYNNALRQSPAACLAQVRADDGSGWHEYEWPEKVPPSKYEFYVTDAGCLMYDNGVWLELAEYRGWNPTDAEVTRFYVVPDYAEQQGAAK